MNSAPAAVKDGSIQEVARRPFLPRVENRQAAEPAEVQAASGRQLYPASKCRRRADYPRNPAPLAWVSPNQEETTSPPVAEA